MNQGLKSRFIAGLKMISGEGTAGEALERNLLERQSRKIRIPNALYSVLVMLGDEYENQDTIYTEYCGRCFKQDCGECSWMRHDPDGFHWYFWYTRQEYAVNITGTTVCELDDEECSSIVNVDRGENDIRFKIYARLACQCMVIYDTPISGCYLPQIFFRLVKYVWFLCSYKAFFAALKSAVKYCDEETNYTIRETLGTVLGLKDVSREEFYGNISRMQGNEKAAVARMIAEWGVGGDLQKNLIDMIHNFERGIRRPEIRIWINEHKAELKRVLGEELLYQLREHCWQNAAI